MGLNPLRCYLKHLDVRMQIWSSHLLRISTPNWKAWWGPVDIVIILESVPIHIACFSSLPQLPNICSSDDVTCKLEMISQGHCLEYNYDYDNGFSIGMIHKHYQQNISYLVSVSHLYSSELIMCPSPWLMVVSSRGLGQHLGSSGHSGLCLLWVRLCYRHPAGS